MNRLAPCMLCGAVEMARPFPARHPWLARCRTCSFVFASDRPSDEEAARYYAAYPRQEGVSPITVRRFEEALADCEAARKTNRLLDFGAGDGFFAEQAVKHGWEAYASELADHKRSALSAKGVRALDLVDLAAHRGGFDVIVAQEVVEHMC